MLYCGGMLETSKNTCNAKNSGVKKKKKKSEYLECRKNRKFRNVPMGVERHFSLYIPTLGQKTHEFKAENMEKVLVINCASGEKIFALCYLFSIEHLICNININDYFS